MLALCRHAIIVISATGRLSGKGAPYAIPRPQTRRSLYSLVFIATFFFSFCCAADVLTNLATWLIVDSTTLKRVRVADGGALE